MRCICDANQHEGYHSAECIIARFKEADLLRESLRPNPCIDCKQMVYENFTHVECECGKHTDWKKTHA